MKIEIADRQPAELAWGWLKFQFSSPISAADQAAFEARFLKAVNGTWEHSGWI